MEYIIRDFPFIRVYIDNFIIFLILEEEYLQYLERAFKRLDKL